MACTSQAILPSRMVGPGRHRERSCGRVRGLGCGGERRDNGRG